MNDTIPMREGEALDVARVAAYLRGRLEGSDQRLRIRQFPGGKANLTYLLDYGARRYVLRRPPHGPVAPSAHDMAREYQVLSRLYQHFPPAPRAHHFCDDPAVVGAPFFVMDYRDGVVVRERMPPCFADEPEAARRMSEALVDALADFHAVDYEAAGLGTLGRPDGFIQRQVAGWFRRWQGAAAEEIPAMEEVYLWLAAHLPESRDVSLLHNDFKLDNVLLDPADAGRIVAIFDWDMATLGDPLSDLGALLAYWSVAEDPPALQALALMPREQPGFLDREALVARYAARSGRDVSQISFYHALGLFRVAVIVAQIYIRYRRGQTQDPRFAPLGAIVPFLARAALQVTRE